MSQEKIKALYEKAEKAKADWKAALKEDYSKETANGMNEKDWQKHTTEKVERLKAEFFSSVEQARNLEANAETEKQMEEASSTYERFLKEPTNRMPKGNGNGTPGPQEQQIGKAPTEIQAAINTRVEMGATHADKAMISEVLNRPISAVERQHIREAFVAFLKEDRGGAVRKLESAGSFGPQEIQLLSGNVGNLGGYTVPEDFRSEVVRPRPGFAAVRMAGARSMPTNSDTLVMPRVVSGTDPYSSGVSGAWRNAGYVSGGTAPSTQNQPTVAQERIQVFWWQPNVIELDPSLLMDNAVNLEMVIAEELGRTKGLDEDSAFINGTGVGQPLGLLNAGFTSVALADDAVSYATGLDLIYGVPSQYRAGASHLMSSSTYSEYMKLETASGVTLIYPAFATQGFNRANQAVANLQGYPVYFSEFMSSLSSSDDAGTVIQVFGDFFYYVIAERMEMRVQRLIERYAPNVGLLASARVGGQPVLNDAFRVGTVA